MRFPAEEGRKRESQQRNVTGEAQLVGRNVGMKFARIFSNILFGLGCALAFAGLLALVLPMIENDQLQLVLSSLQMPSERFLVNAMSGAMSYAMAHCYGVMLTGAALTLGAALLMLWLGRLERAEFEKPYANARGKTRQDSAAVYYAAQEPAELEYNPFADLSVQELLKPRAATDENVSPLPNWDAILPKTRNVESPYARPVQNEAPPQLTSFERQIETPEPAPSDGVPQGTESVAERVNAAETAEASAAENVQSEMPLESESNVYRPTRLFVSEAEAGAKSQSGSRVIVRSTFPTSQRENDTPPVKEDENEGLPERKETQVSEAPARPATASTRIRSTMGRHT